MKIKPIIFLIAIVLLSASSAFSQWINSTSWSNGYSYSYEISDETVEDTPSFNPEKEPPPLSIRKALEVARDALKRFVPKASDKLKLSQIILQRVDQKWIYEVEFNCPEKDCANEDFFKIYVKMNGKIVEPKIESEKNSNQP